jgi:hypothetical protein
VGEQERCAHGIPFLQLEARSSAELLANGTSASLQLNINLFTKSTINFRSYLFNLESITMWLLVHLFFIHPKTSANFQSLEKDSKHMSENRKSGNVRDPN